MICSDTRFNFNISHPFFVLCIILHYFAGIIKETTNYRATSEEKVKTYLCVLNTHFSQFHRLVNVGKGFELGVTVKVSYEHKTWVPYLGGGNHVWYAVSGLNTSIPGRGRQGMTCKI